MAIYKFKEHVNEDFIAQSPDRASNVFDYILEEWKNLCRNREYIKEMDAFTSAKCGGWK